MAAVQRMWFVLTTLIWLAASIPLDPAPMQDVEIAEQPTHLPGNDSWYGPPEGWAKQPPGAILKYRKAPYGLSMNNKVVIKIKDLWQIQYRTQNGVGKADTAVVSVAVPFNPRLGRVLMYNWFSDAGYGDCNPSLGMQAGTRPDNTYTQMQTAVMLTTLQQGWMTVINDDGGNWGSFGSARNAGYKNLDAMRAVRASEKITGIPADAKLVTLGYSGGAFGGEFAAELHATYAPELKIDGVAVGGVLPSIQKLLTWERNNRTSYMPPVLVSLARDYKNFSSWLDEAIKPEIKESFWKTATQCYDTNWEHFARFTPGHFFVKGIDSLWDKIPQSVFEQASRMGTVGTPKVPMYMWETVGDDTSPIEMADELIKKHCDNGANIVYERNPRLFNHSTEMIMGMPGAMRWAADRFEGKPTIKGCTNQTQSPESIKAARQGMIFTGIFGIGLGMLNQSVGPNFLSGALTTWPA